MLVQDETDKLLMVPGPTPVHREILAAIAEPTVWHSSDAMADIVRRCVAGLRMVAGAPSARVYAFAGSGTLAQEAAVVNLVRPGERILVVSNGYFGERFAAIAQAYGIEVERLVAESGMSGTAAQLRELMRNHHFRAVTITHVDTSTGTAAPIEDLASVAREHGALAIVDSVCGLGGMPVEMDANRIDVVLSGTQKALGVPPGLALLVLSERAVERRRELDRVPAFYADLRNWDASMDAPQTYFSTHAVNLFYALARSLDIIEEEGLAARFARHQRLARAFRAGMAALGFSAVTRPEFEAATLSVLEYPPEVDGEAFRAGLSSAGVVAAPGIGELKGRAIRFGHMGNIAEAEILRTLAAAEAASIQAGGRSEPGTALAAAQASLSGREKVASSV